MNIDEAIELSRIEDRTVELEVESIDEVLDRHDCKTCIELEDGRHDAWGSDWRLLVSEVSP